MAAQTPGVIPANPQQMLASLPDEQDGVTLYSALGELEKNPQLFVIVAGITLFTGRGLFFSGGRQVLFGLAAAGITYAIGHLIGVSIVG